MKKFLSIILCIAMLSCVFAACSKGAEEETTTTKATSTSKQYPTTEVITTDPAKITESDAINLIQSYPAKELGLTDAQVKKCSFMVASSGIQIEKDYYVKVIATVKKEHKAKDGKVTFTFDNQGEYYIRYDGKQILKKDMKADEEKFDEMKVREVPAPTTVVEHTSETTKKQ